MKKYLFFLSLFFLIESDAFSQRISPLFQFVNTNSQLTKVPALRNLRNQLDEELGKEMDPGLKLDVLYNKLSAFRKEFLSKLDIDNLTINGVKLQFSFNSNIFKTDISNKSLNSFLENDLMTFLSPQIQNFVENAFRLANISKTQSAVLTSIFKKFKETNLNGSKLPYIESSNPTTKELSDYISKIIVTQLKQKIASTASRLQPSFNPDANLDLSTLSSDWPIIFKFSVSEVRGYLSQIIDLAESEIKSALDGISTFLAGANSALALTDGQGNFTGGIFLSYSSGNWFQSSLYFNGEFERDTTSTTKQATQSLMGLQVRGTWENWQIDFFLSSLFGDKAHPDAFSKIIEGGGGATYSSKALTVGLYLFSQINTARSENNVTSWGLIVGINDANAPKVMIGNASYGSISLFNHIAMQIIIPILPSL